MNAPASELDADLPMDMHPYRSISKRPGRVKGALEDRLSGLHDLLRCAQGASVLDIGINHGLISFEFARHGAALVHGCDIHKQGVETAREIFTEVRTQSRFDVVDLMKGPAALEKSFGADYRSRYDIVLFLSVYHLLKQQVSDGVIRELVHHLVDRTQRFFAVRTIMIDELRTILAATGLQRVHFSALSSVVSPVEIWRRD
jgi:2-polyprenyl-3-methyl-5-hydroxy-6-metoxy-1,4-benzoquinol methylase